MAPELPGFYYDEAKKKYFRITNGDQRHNAQYSNSQTQADKRRKVQKEKTTAAGTKFNSNGGFSRQASQCKYYPQTTDLLLNLKLGIASISDGWPLLYKLTRCENMVLLKNEAAWLLEDKEKLICATGNSMTFYNTSKFVKDVSCQPESTHLWNISRRVKQVKMTKEYIAVQFGDSSVEVFNVLNDSQCVGTQVLQVEAGPGSPNIQFDLKRNRFALVNEGKAFFCSLKEGKVSQSVQVFPKEIPVDGIECKLGYLVLFGGKTVSLRQTAEHGKYKKGESEQPLLKLDFKKKVLRVFLESSNQVHGKTLFMRLIVVTSDEIHVYSLTAPFNAVREQDLKRQLKVAFKNDNIAMPIVFRIGNQVLVEVSGSSFMKVDLTKGRADLINLPCFRNSRPALGGQHWGRSFLFHEAGRVFISSSDCLSKLTIS